MEQLPYDNLEELSQLIKTVFSGDNQSVRRAHEVIERMGTDLIRFTDSIMKVITSDAVEDDVLKVKRGASLIIQRSLSSIIERNTFPIEQKTYILESIIKSTLSPTVPNTIKITLQQVLTIIFCNDRTGDLAEKNILFAAEKLTDDELNSYEGAFCIIMAIIANPKNSLEALTRWFLSLWENLVISGNNIIKTIHSNISDISQHENLEQKLVNIEAKIEALRMWAKMLVEFIKKLGRGVHGLLGNKIENLTDKEQLANVCIEILKLQVPLEVQIKECLFSTSNVKKLDDILNSTKAIICKGFMDILGFMEDAQITGRKTQILNSEHNKFYRNIHTDGLKLILQSFFELCRNNYSKMESRIKNMHFQECLTECLRITSKMILFEADRQDYLFFEKKELIIADVCLPLIASQKQELELLELDPGAFVSLTRDLNEEDADIKDSVKVQAVNLMQKLCENVSGTLPFMIGFIESLMDFSIIHNAQESALEQYPKLLPYKESTIIKMIEPRIQVETCLLVLRGLSNEIKSRPDLEKITADLIARHFEKFVSAQSDLLLQMRMCELVPTILSSMSKNQSLTINQLINLLLQCIGYQDSAKQILSQVASEILEEILFGDETAKLRPFAGDLLKELILYVPYIKALNFFDAIKTLIGYIKKPLVLVDLTKVLVERILSECESLEQDETASRVLPHKIWNNFDSIGNHKSYTEIRTEVENLLTPLFVTVINKDLKFEENIINFICSTTKKTASVSLLAWKVFESLPVLFERSEGVARFLYDFMSKLVLYGKNEIQNNMTIIKPLITLGIQGLNSRHPDADGAHIACVAVFFQTLIENIEISETEWKEILDAFLNKLRHPNLSNFVKARIGGVFLLSFEKKFEITQSHLSDEDGLEDVMNLFANRPIIFGQHVYDRKIFITGLSSLLPQESLNPVIKQNFPQFLDTLVSFLAFTVASTQSQGSKNKKPSLADMLNNDIPIQRRQNDFEMEEESESGSEDDDEDEDDDDDEDDSMDGENDLYFPTEKDEANHYLKALMPFRNNIDEFQKFREAINELKTNDSQLYKKLTLSLSEKKKKYLSDTLKTQNVAVEGKILARKILQPSKKRTETK